MNRLYSAYVGAIFAPNNGNGWRSVQIERLGAVEVRPIEFAETQSAKELGIWIELYDHGSQSWLTAFAAESLDEEAELLLEQLMRSAQRLTEPPTDLGPRQ